jgi:hypothetical protein
MGLQFTIATGPRQRSHSLVRVPQIHDHTLLSQILDFLKMDGYISQEKGGPVIPPGTDIGPS